MRRALPFGSAVKVLLCATASALAAACSVLSYKAFALCLRRTLEGDSQILHPGTSGESAWWVGAARLEVAAA